MARVYTAYGINYTADEWADILFVSPSTVRKHGQNQEGLECWIADMLGSFRNSVMDNVQAGTFIAAMYDREVWWKIYDMTRVLMWELDLAMKKLNRKSAVFMPLEDDLESLITLRNAVTDVEFRAQARYEYINTLERRRRLRIGDE